MGDLKDFIDVVEGKVPYVAGPDPSEGTRLEIQNRDDLSSHKKEFMIKWIKTLLKKEIFVNYVKNNGFDEVVAHLSRWYDLIAEDVDAALKDIHSYTMHEELSYFTGKQSHQSQIEYDLAEKMSKWMHEFWEKHNKKKPEVKPEVKGGKNVG